MNEITLSNQLMIEIRKALTTRWIKVNIKHVPLKAYAAEALSARRISDPTFNHAKPFRVRGHYTLTKQAKNYF